MKLKIAIILTTISLLGGCGNNTQIPEGDYENIIANKQSATPVSVQIQPVQNIVNEQTLIKKQELTEEQSNKLCENSIKILQSYYKENENNLISPLSLQSALALLLDASEGETLSELLRAYGLTQSEIEQSIQCLMGTEEIPENITEETLNKPEDLKSLLQAIDPLKTIEPSQLNEDDYRNIYKITNAIWSNNRKFKAEYEKAVREKYNSEVHSSDLTTQEGITEVNKWVKKNTLGLIDSVLAQPQTPDTSVILLNTIGFECKWVNPFLDTIPEQDFTTSDGTKVKVELMTNSDGEYIETDKARGVKLLFQPYNTEKAKHKFSMIVVLPKENSLNEYINNITLNELKSLSETQEDVDTYIKLPKFNFENTINIVPVLNDLGIKRAFIPTGDIKMTTDGKIQFISDALQKTKIEVTEYGTKAAAVTAIMMKDNAMLIDERRKETVIFDRPFMYMIWDEINQVPIFIGTENNPAQQA